MVGFEVFIPLRPNQRQKDNNFILMGLWSATVQLSIHLIQQEGVSPYSENFKRYLLLNPIFLTLQLW